MGLLTLLSALLGACQGRGGDREQPGDTPNPVLADLLQKAIDAEIGRMNPVWAPGLLPQAPQQARAWLGEIDEVVARCRYGPGNRTKSNLLEYDVRLRSGEQIQDVYSGLRCLYGTAPPLVMRVRFETGQVREVLTDGREREASTTAASNELRQFAHSVVRLDWDRRESLYFPPAKTPQDIAREWTPPPR